MIAALVLFAGAGAPVVAVHREGPVYHVSVDVVVELPRERVWSLLTSYDDLARLSESIRESKRVADEDGAIIVDTVTRGCSGFFCRTVRHRQSVVETPPGRIVAMTIPGHSDVREGSAEWSLTDVNGATRIRYEMTMRPAFFVPPLLGPGIVRRALRDEMYELVAGLQREAGSR